MFDFIPQFFGTILGFFDSFTHNYIVALALFALVVQVLLIPFAIKQQKNSIKQAKLAPKLAAIRKKYAGRDDRVTKQKLQQETMDLYQQEGFNPAGGCLPLLIQMPIIFILYRVITEPLRWVAGVSQNAINVLVNAFGITGNHNQIQLIGPLRSALSAGEDIVSKCDFSAFTDATQLEAVKSEVANLSADKIPNFTIGKLELAKIPQETLNTELWWLIFIPIITIVMMLATQYITRKLTYQSPEAVEQQKSPAMKIMNLAMPLLSGYFAFILPSAIGIYWFIRNVYQVIQQIIIAKVKPLPEFSEEDYKAAERELKGKTTQKKVEKNPDAGSKRSLFHMDDDDYVPPADDDNKQEAAQDGKKPAIEAAPLKDDAADSNKNKDEGDGDN